jgi:hypothetical protein
VVPRDPKLPAHKACSEWDIEQDEERLFPKILSRNEDHFAQAENTPLSRGSLGKELGHDGTSKAAQEVLQGKRKPDYPLKETRMLTIINLTSSSRRHCSRLSEGVSSRQRTDIVVYLRTACFPLQSCSH